MRLVNDREEESTEPSELSERTGLPLNLSPNPCEASREEGGGIEIDGYRDGTRRLGQDWCLDQQSLE